MRMLKKNSKQDKHSFQLKPICVAVLLVFSAQNADANPVGGAVVNGQASFNTTGSTLTVTNTPGTIINWQGFSIQQNEITRFAQQSASSAVLNRVITNNPSLILGTLQSNGRVFLVNPSGIVFGTGSTVDVAGLVATTQNLSNADFKAGRYQFTQVPGAQNISNAGNITAQSGGEIYLIAPNVENSGVITAPNGEILLVAGHEVQLVNSLDPNLRVNITAPAGNATNVGQLIASAGRLGLFGAVARNTGTVSADSAVAQGGKIVLRASQRVEAGGTISAQGTGGGEIKLLADMQTGTVNVTGKLDASAPNSGNGGFIETSAAHVQVADTVRVSTAAPNGKAGIWLIDPMDYTIAAADPGNGSSYMSNTTLATNLDTGGGNITIQTSSVGSGGSGYGDIIVSDAVSWTSSNSLTLNAIRDVNINAALTNTGTGGGNLIVRADLNGTGTGTILFGGGSVALTSGRADLYYNPVSYSDTATKSDSLTNPYSLNITGTYTAWMLVNDITQLQAMNTNLAGTYALGRVVDATVTATWNAGAGFVPVGDATTNFTGQFDGLGHTISNLTINLPTTDNVGLFGYAGTGSVIRNVGMIGGSVSGQSYVGELVGQNIGTISNNYATGSVNGVTGVGGLAGTNFGAVSNSYATSNVSGSSYIGGLVGINNTGTITNSYSTGSVTGGGLAIGGLVGQNNNGGTITNSYWDTQTSGQADLFDGRGTGLTTAQMMTQASFTGFDFGTTWWMSEGNTRPFLQMEYSTTITNAHQLQLMSMNLGASYTLGANIDASETALASGMWSSSGFVPVGNASFAFTGQFDGLGQTITRLYINRPTESYVGLFGNVGTGSVISNVAMVNGSVSGSSFVGTLMGANSGTINNSSVAGGTVTGVLDVGGLVGQNNGAINGSYSSDSATPAQLAIFGGAAAINVGGLVGLNNGIISGSYVTDGSGYGVSIYFVSSGAGGLVGNNSSSGSITNSYVIASTSGVWVAGTNSVGGLVGNNSGSISSSYVNGGSVNVSGVGGSSLNVGGLAGLNSGSIINSSVISASVSGGTNVGGLVGYNTGTISGGYNSGATVDNVTVSGNLNVGGLVGNNFGSTSSGVLISGGSISSTYVNGGTVGINCTDCGGIGIVGGLVGLNSGSISNSYVTSGTVVTGIGNSSHPFSDVGGLVGSNSGSIVGSHVSAASVTGTKSVGGLVGYSSGTISNSYVDTGTVVTGYGNYVGGLVGYNSGTIDSSSHVSGATIVSGVSDVGGLVGYNYYGNISNSYVDTGTVVTGSGSYVGGLVGYNDSGNISYSYVDTVTVTGSGSYVGGLVGYNAGYYSSSSGAVIGGSIGNSYVNGGTVNGVSYVGGLVGYNQYGSIDSSHVSATHVSGGQDVGGLVGYNNGYTSSGVVYGGSISNSYVDTGTVVTGSGSNVYDVGGLVGNNQYGSISNSYVDSGIVTGIGSYYVNDVGGLVGYNYGGTISNSHVSGSTVTGIGNYSVNEVGGLVGYNTGYNYKNTSYNYIGSIDSSYVSATTVSGVNATGGLVGNSVGGLVGKNGGTISNSYVDTGTVVNGSQYVGGLLGYDSGEGVITGNTVTATTVNGNDYVGGMGGKINYVPPNSCCVFAGYADGNHVVNSFVNGGVVSGGSYVGGLVGENGMPISNSSVSGTTVNGSSYVGGLVGYNYGATYLGVSYGGSISNSYVDTGTVVTGSGNYVGGLVGYNDIYGSISSSHVSATQVIGNNTSYSSVGGLVGANYGTISNSYVDTGTVVSGRSGVGGLVGSNYGTISGSHVSAASVTGGNSVGGLVGYNSGTISNSYVDTGTVVSGGSYVGGLVGYNTGSGSIIHSYVSNSNISGTSSYAGGLVGYNDGSISGSYVSGGSVTGWYAVGGLVGYNGITGTIDTSYVSGTTVTGSSSRVGGLVGYNNGFISQSYAASGTVSGGGYLGGVVGYNDSLGGAIVSGNFWDTSTAGVTNGIGYDTTALGVTDAGATGLTSTQMMQLASFTGWNIANTGGSGAVWRIYEGHTTPLLVSFLTPLTLTDAPDAIVTYNGFSQSGLSSAITGVLGSPLGAAATGTNAGFYNGYYSTQQGYDITGGNLTITPAAVTLLNIKANDASKTYGTTLTFTGSEFTPVGLLNGDTISGVTLTSAGAVNTAPATTYSIVVTPGSEIFSLGSASNYTFTYAPGVLTVNSAPLTVTADALSKIYGNPDPALTYTTSGLLFSDFLSGSLSRVAGQNVGSYAINQGTLNNTNYAITYNSNNLSITQRSITVTASATTKVYGNADPGTFTVAGGLAPWDTNSTAFTGALSHTGGENVVSSPYPITQGTLAASSNYSASYIFGATLTITPALLTVVADSYNKVLGTPDPLFFDYIVSGLRYSDTAASTLTGALSRNPGDTIGSYNIGQNTLALNTTNFASTNYTLSYVPGIFNILAPTVVQEITQISLLPAPKDGNALTSAEEEKRLAEQLAASEQTMAEGGGGTTEPLRVCR